jgi:GT2 family glycosyltransferase
MAAERGVHQASIGVCITTRHRPELLEQCLEHLGRADIRPTLVVVSDDSTEPASIDANRRIVEPCSEWVAYVDGPHNGVCANRNHALDVLRERRDVDLVAFLDDDALVDADYFDHALATIAAAPPGRRERTIVSGVRIDERGERTTPTKLNFSGYFVASATTEVAGASYAIYPASFFDAHRWDELIFFGYEDAELSLRALRDGYTIEHCPTMLMTDAGRQRSSMLAGDDAFDSYNFFGEAARLYVGVKRFLHIDRSLVRLAVFVPMFFAQVTWSLAKRRSLRRLPELIRRSNVTKLLRRAPGR